MIGLVLIAVLGFATADVEKRQLPTCTNAFTLTNNPCFAGNQVFYYPVPGDNTKFVQCDSNGAAYVVQCPVGRVYDSATTTCRAPIRVTNPPINPAPVATAAGPSNACTSQNIATGRLYYAFPGDNTRYYRCTGINQVAVVVCPANLVWDQSRVSCVLGFGGATTNRPITAAPAVIQNPCTKQQLASQHYYFSHPDPTKFIQCDLTGQFFVLNCPKGLSWSQFYQVCSSPATNTIVGKK